MSDLIWHIHTQTIPAALSLLPGAMDSREARAEMLTIGLQESGFNARMQGGHGTRRGTGPASGFFQFERAGGVKEILTSPDTKDYALRICRMFLYEPTPRVVHAALADHDVLACVFARLLLWRDPRTMPSPIEAEKGWRIYLANWRPGKPRPKHWPGNFKQAWAIVKGDEVIS
jgi:hypothetical protein